MDVLGGRSVVALGDHELLPVLDDLDAEIIQLEALRLQVVARIEESGYAKELGARDTVDLLAFRHRRDRADVWREVRLARALPKYAAVDAALADGIDLPAEEGAVRVVRPMRTAHAAAIVSELERVRSRVPVENLDTAEEQLVSLAAHLAPKELRAAAKQICDLLDSDGPEPEELKAYARETLTLTAAENGVKFRGFLANEDAELLRAVIHAGARPHKTSDGELDPRSREKRQADALTTALTLAAKAWDTNTAAPDPAAGATEDPSAEEVRRGVPGHGAKANITVTIDLEDLKAAIANAIGHTVYGDGLSAATIRRLACDAKVIPLVLGSNSEPLDVGRCERLVTRAMRRALNTRDRGCVVCGAPPIMCDAHHLVSWIDGGITAVSNLALLCRRHHVDLHNGHWTITITNGKVHVTRPTWANPPPRHRPTPPPTSPADTHARPHPPGTDPAHPDPLGTDPARPDPPGTDPACPGTSAARPLGLPASTSAVPEPSDGAPWDGTAPPAADTTEARTSRWKAAPATLAEAARFAVWGAGTSTDSDTGPPSFATI
ncbi:MAG TPA: DUF222 domain-containing protein [Kribbella sp.]